MHKRLSAAFAALVLTATPAMSATLYGADRIGSPSTLFQIDTATGTATAIGNTKGQPAIARKSYGD